MATIHPENVSLGHIKHVTAGIVTFEEEVVRSSVARRFLAGLRIIMGFTFLWPFFDKLFGLGYRTAADKGWLDGGTPAQGFMKGAEGPFGSFFNNIAGPWADWLFMAGLLGIGVALLAGAGLKLAAITGTLLLFLMYLVEFPLGRTGEFTNPLFDSHWIEALAIIVLAATYAGDTWGVGKWWGRHVGNGILR
ncbi:MAG TPA: DoxX family protein [Intrasporangium sp.]|uniref:DoxX family protein n=1 Tax=Intrasporangium sp. TaxID=1925024 RepID=UPI002D7670CE|nr:DoxX family protein [Intrasporangium sp.]HET7396920.1 DoxX family protein [Intrasporangium sp.]